MRTKSKVTYWGPLSILLVLSTAVGAVLKAPVEKLLTSAQIPVFEIPENVEALVHGAEHTAVGIALAGLVVGVVLFVFAYGAVKAFAQTSWVRVLHTYLA